MDIRVGLIVGVGSVLTGGQATGADYRWLGTLPNVPEFRDSYAVGISFDGSTVIGTSSSDQAVEVEGFTWTQTTGMVGHGSIGFPVGVDSLARAVSDDGSVVLGSLYDYGGQSGGFRMYTLSPGGNKQPIDLPIGYERTQGGGISANGGVLAGSATQVGQNHSDAFVWTADGGYEFLDLGPRNVRNRYTYVNSLSGDGGVAVGRVYTINYGSANTKNEAYRWDTAGSSAEFLGYLPGGDNDYSLAHDVSADGTVIVGLSDSGAAEFAEAFRWTQAGGMVGLGDLPGGDFYSRAVAVSADGSVIVGESEVEREGFSRRHEPFIWTPDAGMLNLRDVFLDAGLDADFVDSIYEVVDVSGDGQTFVGNGLGPSGGFSEAWIVSLAEAFNLSGDYNGNGLVDAADYTVWADHFGSTTNLTADGNGDGIVDAADYTVWQDNFGNANISTRQAASIPEPTTGLALLTLAGLATRGRRRVDRPVI